MDRRKSPSRAGFTLVEVLVVILILATLVAILLPAVMGAVRTARQAQVTTEINNLATALASFKTTYGDYPPSRIILSETGYANVAGNPNAAALYATTMIPGEDTNDSDLTAAQLTQRTLLYLRKFWPRVDFNGSFDFNNSAKGGTLYTLSGSECLAFFLGGQPLHDGAGNITGVNGFSKLPTNPFNAASTNRTVPNYDFNAGRLVDLDNDGVPSYLDPFDTTPGNRRSYAYFSSYGTNSYDPNDVNGVGKHYDPSDPRNNYEHEDPADPSTPGVERGFTVAFPPGTVVSPGPNPYCSSAPIPTTGSVSWINPNSFQLFAAGADRLWGMGGTYAQNSLGSTGKLPIVPGDTGIVNITPPYNDFADGIRTREADNLTNFSGGRLD